MTNLHDKTEYAIHIRNLKQALDHGLVLEKMHRIIKKNDFEKDFFKLMKNAAYAETIRTVRKHRDIKLVTTERRRRNYLVSKPNYHRKSISNRDKKKQRYLWINQSN